MVDAPGIGAPGSLGGRPSPKPPPGGDQAGGAPGGEDDIGTWPWGRRGGRLVPVGEPLLKDESAGAPPSMA